MLASCFTLEPQRWCALGVPQGSGAGSLDTFRLEAIRQKVTPGDREQDDETWPLHLHRARVIRPAG